MSTSEINDTVIEQLVAGELTPARYREVLKQLDMQPDKWRDCAIAFLEEQAIESEMRALAAMDVQWSVDEQLGFLPAPRKLDLAVGSASQPASVSYDAATARMLRFSRYTSLAALLLVSFTVGWVGSGMRGGSSDAPPTYSSNQSVAAKPSTRQPAGLDSAGQAVDPRGWDEPMMFTSGGYLPIDRQVPAELLELERSGRIRIESHDGLVPVQLENGTQAVVPMQLYHAVPVGQSY